MTVTIRDLPDRAGYRLPPSLNQAPGLNQAPSPPAGRRRVNAGHHVAGATIPLRLRLGAGNQRWRLP